MTDKYHNKKTTEKTETLPNQETKNPRKTIGHYTILEKLGEGGMGVVYLAQQNTPIKRKVALKVIKPGMDTKEIIARFESERQALALMSHPHIAQVYDGGETDDAYPFFVMEYVPGLPITEYCDKFKLSIEERLSIFIKVCEAVQHAHYKGIVHRDLKPTNIICSFVDEKHVPKIIDFGISKALTGQGLTEKTVYTKIGVPMGTTLYMSPEQAELSGHDIDTRTDVYSLGMILYELLVGKIPYDFEELNKADFVEMFRVIKEKSPPKPSIKFNSLGDGKKTVAEKRKSSHTNISRILKGDLDKILMKALEKDKRYRYNSAIDLALDLQRYLNKEPISARPPNFFYLVKKYLIRNKLKVAVLISVLLLVVVVGTLFFFFSKKIDRTFIKALNEQILAVTPDEIKYSLKKDTLFENEFRISSVEPIELKNLRIYHKEKEKSEFGYPDWLSVEREYDSKSKTLLFRYSIDTRKSGEYKCKVYIDVYRSNHAKVDFDIEISDRFNPACNVLLIGPFLSKVPPHPCIDFLNTIDVKFNYLREWRNGLKLDEYSLIITKTHSWYPDDFVEEKVNLINKMNDLVHYVIRGGNLYLKIEDYISENHNELINDIFKPLDFEVIKSRSVFRQSQDSYLKILLNRNEIEKCEITNGLDFLRFEAEIAIRTMSIRENINSKIILKNPDDHDYGFLVLHEYGGKLIISTLMDQLFQEPNRKLMENIFLLKRTEQKE